MAKGRKNLVDRFIDFLIRCGVGFTCVLMIAFQEMRKKQKFESVLKKRKESEAEIKKCLYCDTRPVLKTEVLLSGAVEYRLVCDCKTTKPHTIKEFLVSKWNSAIYSILPKKKSEKVSEYREVYPPFSGSC